MPCVVELLAQAHVFAFVVEVDKPFESVACFSAQWFH